MRPQAIILAGPNGAGKSTSALYLLPPHVTFVNADNIAKELREQGKSEGTAADIAAGRLLLQRLADLEKAKVSFAVETNLSNRTLALRVPRWQAQGYRVHLLYLWLASADLAVERVAERVRGGGHDIPELTIRRRYVAGLRNFFQVYVPIVDAWTMYDNTILGVPQPLAHGMQSVFEPVKWKQIRQFATSEVPE